MSATPKPQQLSFEHEAARTLLDDLLTKSRLYTRSQDYKDLLDFVSRMRNVAPFNALLLQVQKPGLSYAASAYDWETGFGRRPKEGARPLLILWPFAPVATVYDVLDTEGAPLPEDVFAYVARGDIDKGTIERFVKRMGRKNIRCLMVNSGDLAAGHIRVVHRPSPEEEKKKKRTEYSVQVNSNHSPPVQFTTIAHELGHLFLGHLGRDSALDVPDRRRIPSSNVELEAESVAYLVCRRARVSSKSETYLSNYVKENTSVAEIDVYQIMRAAGQVERLLELTEHTRFEKPVARGAHQHC